jgi:DNA invertase Pin-like site-specific DNA recombinase
MRANDAPRSSDARAAGPIGHQAELTAFSPRHQRPAKIQARHEERLAVVYVRQSTPQQVLEHRESAALQYDLRRRAIEMGWPAERVLIIDDDQGHSARTAEGRPGFQRLLAEVGLDHVGLILGIEMSRLARSCKDWHQLLELCALFGTLLADQDGLYDPTDYNDRLLLGLKGTMSEAELHILRARMDQGRRNKARRGELFTHPPIGYVRTPSGEFALDPDEQARDVVRLIFDTFDELGSLSAMLRYLVRHDIRLGVRAHSGPDRGQLQWRPACHPTLLTLLHNPIYAGAYAYGRRPTDPRRKIPGRPSTGHTYAPIDRWQVLIRDRLPAYITWDRYLANQRRLSENRSLNSALGAPREGPSLLGGLLVCGRCGHRLSISYGGKASLPHYGCHHALRNYAAPPCQSLAARPLDELVSRLVLRVVEPATLELSLQAASEIVQQRAQLTRHWQQRLERARYEASRAERQYHAVEPENRLVARELERRWEQALREQRHLEEEYDRYLNEQPPGLSEGDRELVQSLASDLPALWEAPSTTSADRQVIIRHLVERIVVEVQGESERVDVAIHWAGGFVSRHEIRRPVGRYEQLHDFGALLKWADELYRAGQSPERIAERLNAEGFRPPKYGKVFNRTIVYQLLSRRHLIGPRPHARDEGQLRRADEWWLGDLARKLAMSSHTLYSWLRRGWAHGRQLSAVDSRWLVWADAEELDRLRRLRACPRNRDSSGVPYPPDLTTPKHRPEA